ncbi:hypothetical protein FJP64_08035 [Kosakonia cowanii]|uniref:hypothetical protein n=2 Tax=Kosakonia cowanii TaxID=208223 RepID=UPI00111CCF25|nr:hypothetical protein [Kosakonia cowanii]MDP9770971.1 hypothetical protein [Atlantibacter hermannii]TPD66503.1 hypothetical protein FJP70_09240 [Kosakonia cowanii]TPD90040.1 hypothetical protein FJP67_09240 [Kosakonia cowanii]TPE06069.1 hypothetical protein FJP64_08035 [Kosakonia cowanii]
MLKQPRPDKALAAIRQSFRHIALVEWFRSPGAVGSGIMPLKPRRPDKRYAPSGIISAAQLPDGGCALSGLQKRAYSDTVFAFICNMKARGCVPAEIGEPERE